MPSLRLVLWADFAGALFTVLALGGAASLLSPHVHVDAVWLRTAAVLLVPFVAFVFHTAARAPAPGRVRGIIVFNSVWFVASLLWLALGTFSALGFGIVLGQAVAIVPLVACELHALRAP